MPLTPPLPPDSMPVDTAAQLAAHADGHGHFEALREVFAYFPAALQALDTQYDLMIGQGRLDRGLRELILPVPRVPVATNTSRTRWPRRPPRTSLPALTRLCDGRVGRGTCRTLRLVCSCGYGRWPPCRTRRLRRT